MRVRKIEIMLRCHNETLRNAREWARLARDQGDEETARAYDRMAAHMARKIEALNNHGAAP